MLLAALLAILSFAPGCTPEPRAAGKNLLLITLDTTRADHISCLGGDPRITPEIDALAARSHLFRNAVSETNVTNPSHVSIMTGLPAIRHGVVNNGTRIPPELDTLAFAARRRGYATAGFVGVQHLGPQLGWRHFDTLPRVRGQLRAGEVTQRTLDWLDQRADQRPFFVWVHYFDPHAVYAAPTSFARTLYTGDPSSGDGPLLTEIPYLNDPARKGLVPWLGRMRDPAYPRALYAAEIHYTDQQIGELLRGVDELGLTDDTVVALVADHGESLGEHGIYYDHAGLYEQSVRIPLILHVPGAGPGESEDLVSTLDVAPTLARLLDLELSHQPGGVSLLPLLAGRSSPQLRRRETFVHQHAHNRAVSLRKPPWKLIWPIERGHRFLPNEPQLFRLDADPAELENLADQQPERVAEMRREIEPWIRLGPVRRGRPTHLDAQAIEDLRALGYVVE